MKTACAAASLVILAGCSAASGGADEQLSSSEVARVPASPTGGIMAPPSDPEVAVRSEFREVESRGTIEAYRVFAQRHPEHPLAREAEARALALARGGRPDW